ncbi:MAG: alginate lyase family protein [Cucumibacter sp.]
MKLFTFFLPALFLGLSSVPATASVLCVQEELAALGYSPGPVDGALGGRTIGAATQFRSDAGLNLPDLSTETAGEWCAAVQGFASSDTSAILRSPAAFILPKDVLLDFAAADPQRRAGFCETGTGSIADLGNIEPVQKIEGFTSRMLGDVERVPGALDAEEFAAGFSAHAALALAADDADAKGQLLDLLQKWAKGRAFLDTASCVRSDGNLIDTGSCREWTVPDGSDLSSMKDATFATFHAVGMIRAYLIALAAFEPEARAAQHADIASWISAIGERLKRPGDVYFGLNMGWYWPGIVNDLFSDRTAAAVAKLERLQAGMEELVNADGSIEDRTTRGDRAMWYQYTSIGEIVVSLELIRAAGLPVSEQFEEHLHSAVALLLDAIEDPASIDPWAKAAHNAQYSGTQEWNFEGWPDENFAGSWLHIYPYRYPQRDEARRLRELVPVAARSATSDTDFGFGLGCIYNSANPDR